MSSNIRIFLDPLLKLFRSHSTWRLCFTRDIYLILGAVQNSKVFSMGGGPSAVGVDIATAYDSTVESTITNLNLSWTSSIHQQYAQSIRGQYTRSIEAFNTRNRCAYCMLSNNLFITTTCLLLLYDNVCGARRIRGGQNFTFLSDVSLKLSLGWIPGILRFSTSLIQASVRLTL